MIKRIPVFIFILLIIALNTYSQGKNDSKALRYHQKALQYYNASAYTEALEETAKALKADDNFIQSWLLSGDIHSLKGNRKDAVNSYKRAVSIDSAFFPPVYYILANLLFEQHEYAECIEYYKKYAAYPKIKEAEKAKLNKNLRISEFRLFAKNNPVPFNPVNLGPNVNTEGYEFVNYITPDNQRLYLTRRMMKGERRDEQFYYCNNINNGNWSPSIDIGAPINTEDDEGAMALSPDGQFLFFSGCNSVAGYGSCDLYMSKLSGDNWSEPVNLGPYVNTSYWESQPCFSSDGRTLYFVSNRPGGMGSSDIWITRLLDNGEWSIPVNAGEVINTPEAERGPFIHPDASTLYFSSNGHAGMGQGDIFYSTLVKGEWTEPVNLGYPINTEDDEVTMIVDSEGRYAYYSSAKENGFGLQDIYKFELPENTQPAKVSYMKGVVFDSVSGTPLQAGIRLLNPFTGDTVISSISNRTDGSYLLVIPSGCNYALNVERKGYLFYSAHFELKDENNFIDPFVKNIPLKPVREGESIVLRNIFFETDSFNLLPASKAELDNLLRLLMANKGMKIQINGHTDDVGTPDYNQVLSEKRAKSVHAYLIKAGIEPKRLQYKGYGSSAPVATNLTPEGRALNRRTEMIVVQLN